MGKRSKQKKAKQEPAGSAAKKPWDRPGKPSMHGGFTGRANFRPQTNLRQGRRR